jgi:hypothetical protein
MPVPLYVGVTRIYLIRIIGASPPLQTRLPPCRDGYSKGLLPVVTTVLRGAPPRIDHRETSSLPVLDFSMT